MPTWTPAQECAMALCGRDILVSAAAGSGKTATLTERIIRSLLKTDENGRHTADISRMLIVTFTRAAAAELRARISTALSEAIAAHPEDRYLYRQLVALGSANICTIDSFYLQPVRANFEQLGLPSAFRMADENELFPIKEQLLNQLIEQHYAAAIDNSAPRAGLSTGILDGNAFARAMDDLLPNRDRGDTAAILLSLYNKLLNFPEGLELLRMGAERLEKQADQPFEQTPEGRIIEAAAYEKLEYAVTQLRPMCERLLMYDKLKKNYYPSFANDLETAEKILQSLKDGCWDDACNIAKTYKTIELQKTQGAADILPEIEDFKTIRAAIAKDLQMLGEQYFSHSIAEIKKQMLHTATTQRMLYTLLSDYDVAIMEQKKRRGVLDFTDVRRYLLQLLLDENGSPTALAHTISDRFDAVYIDEYQDVDTVQDRIFATIGMGGKRYMVGDIKQSIYSFRGAEPTIFSDYREQFYPVKKVEDAPKDPSKGCCVFMSENFRCDRAIIRFANVVCGHTFSVCTDSLKYQTEDELVYGKGKALPYHDVNVVLLETPSRAQKITDPDPATALRPEAVYIADEIARLIYKEKKHLDGSDIHARDIAILMRGTTGAPDIIKALKAHGISTTFAGESDQATNADMSLLINLLSVIDNPRDDVPLMGLLTCEDSPFKLADLIQFRRKDLATSLYDDLLFAIEHPEGYDTATIRRLGEFVSRLDHWRTLSATLPVDRLLRILATEPFLASKTTSAAYLTLYDKALSYQASSFCGLYQFMQYLRRLLDTKKGLVAAGLQGGDDAVSIMSIHKSKGLQFPIVFVASCATTFNSEDSRATIIFDPKLGAATKIYLPETAERQETITRHAMANLVRTRATEEEMRLLYVALTRAKERLYVTAKLQGQAANLLEKIRVLGGTCRHSVMKANRYLDWILASITKTDETPTWKITVLNSDQYRHPHLIKPDPVKEAPDEEDPESNNSSSDEKTRLLLTKEYQAIVQAHKQYRDPRALLRTLPTKAAASKLRVAMLDGTWFPEEFEQDDQSDNASIHEKAALGGDAEQMIRHRIELMQRQSQPFSELLKDSGKATAAERGTAMHLFLQHCNFQKLCDGTLEDEISRLTQARILPARAADILHRGQLTMLCQSNLLSLCKRARNVWREQHFDRFIPYSTLTRNPSLASQLEDYTLYVQGSIDLILEDDNGKLWLFDYKTDRLRDEYSLSLRDQMLADHADQLRIYADAVFELFGRRPDHVCIYSLSQGCTVDLTDAL